MESKYYTPAIEEFHVGFEYEGLESYKGLSKWQKLIYDGSYFVINTKDDSIEFIQEFRKDLVRVRLLNKEDIESLGFKNEGKHYSIAFNDPRKYDDVVHLMHNPNSRWVLLTQGDKESSFYDFKTRFCGYVKNKSELKFIMKCLGILE